MKSTKKFFLALGLLTLILALLGANSVHAIEVTAKISMNALEIAYDSGKGEIWATSLTSYINEMGMNVSIPSESVSVISDANNSLVSTVTVEEGPTNLAYDSGKNEIFTINGYSTVSVISDRTNTLLATLNFTGNPNYGGATGGLIYDSGKGEIWLWDFFTGIVTVISDSTNCIIRSLSLGNNPGPSGLIYDWDKGEIFVIYEQENGGKPGGNPANFLSVISDTNYSTIATIPISDNVTPNAAFDSRTGELYLPSPGNNTVIAVSDRTNSQVATITVGNLPIQATYDSNKGVIFVGNTGDNTMSIISDSTNKVIENFTVGSYPGMSVFDSGKGELFTITGDSTILVISDSSLPSVTPLKSIPEFNAPVILLAMTLIITVAISLSLKRAGKRSSKSF